MRIKQAWHTLWSLDEPHRVTVQQAKGKNGLYFWHEQSGNGEITCHSETFTRHADAIRAARAHCESPRVYIEEKIKIVEEGEA